MFGCSQQVWFACFCWIGGTLLEGPGVVVGIKPDTLPSLGTSNPKPPKLNQMDTPSPLPKKCRLVFRCVVTHEFHAISRVSDSCRIGHTKNQSEGKGRIGRDPGKHHLAPRLANRPNAQRHRCLHAPCPCILVFAYRYCIYIYIENYIYTHNYTLATSSHSVLKQAALCGHLWRF